MTLKEQFNFDLTNGEQIENMQRSNGYYLAHNNDETQTVLFDNGNQYTISAKGEVTEKIDAKDVKFIDRHIIKGINNFIISNPMLTEEYEYSSSNYDDCIEIYQISKDEKKERSIIIRIVLNRDNKRIDIPTIIIPKNFRHNGFGKKILKQIYKIAQYHNFQLFLVQMVESFYDRMVKRGAQIIVPLDVVEITNNTNLD
jgi:hypothetical protein